MNEVTTPKVAMLCIAAIVAIVVAMLAAVVYEKHDCLDHGGSWDDNGCHSWDYKKLCQ